MNELIEKDLELGRFHGDRNADKEDAGHGNGGVALPVLGPTVWPTTHAPHLGPEVTAVGPISVCVLTSSHARSQILSPLFLCCAITGKWIRYETIETLIRPNTQKYI
ncbi:hypothetical protein ACFX2I_040684 [Malus domestica]